MKRTSKIVSVIIAFIMVFALVGIVGACATETEPAVVSITLDTKAAKKDYLVGDTFSADGVIVTAKYDNNENKTVAIGDCTVSQPDMSVKGSKLVKVEYSGKSATYTITVSERHACESKCPICGKCLNADCTEEVCSDKCTGEGEEVTFEAEDLRVSLIAGSISMPKPAQQEGADRAYVGGYDTGATIAYSISAASAGTANLKITVSQRDFKVTDKISIYVNGEILDRAPSVSGNCEWFIFHEVNLGCINLKEGQNIISFVNTGIGVNFDKIVLRSEVALDWYEDYDFTLNTSAAKTAFTVGEEFNYDGLVASVISGGETTTVEADDPDLEVSVPDMTTAGTKTVTVVYNHFYKTTYDISVDLDFEGKTLNTFAGTDSRVTLTAGAGGNLTLVNGHIDNLNNNFGASFTYTVYSPEACKAALLIKVGQRAYDIKITDVMTVTLNGEEFASDTVMNKKDTSTPDWSNFVTVNLGDADLVEGLNTITFTVNPESEKTKGMGFNFESLTLATEDIQLRWYTDLIIDTENVKTVYEIGETFTAENLVVTYIEGVDERALTAEDYELSSPDILSAGEKTVTVSYGGFTKTFTITVNADTAEKNVYEFMAGDKAALSGGAYAAAKDDGNVWIDGLNGRVGAVVSFDIYSSKDGVATLSVIMNKMQKGKKFTDILKISVNGVERDFDTLITFDGDSAVWQAITVKVEIGGIAVQQGKNTITLTSTGADAFWLRGIALESSATLQWLLGELTLDSENVKKDYVAGDELDLTGLVVKCDIGGVETQISADDYTVSSVDMLTAGEKTVTVSYMGLTASFTITVTEPELPKETYTFDDLNRVTTAGGAVVKSQSDGNLWVDGLNGIRGASVKFEVYAQNDGTATLSVLMNKMQKGKKFTDILAINVNGVPCTFETLIDFEGDSAVWQAIVVTVGIGGISLKEGMNTIEFVATGADAFWLKGLVLESATVLGYYYDNLTLDTTNTTKTFTAGDTFTAEGLVVKCVIGGVETTLTANDYTLSSHDLGLAGTQTVTVSYKGLTATYEITVEGAQAEIYSFAAYDGKATIAGGLTANTATGYIDRVNDVSSESAYILYELYASKSGAAKLTVTQNTMQNGKSFANIFKIYVNDVEFTTDAVISYTQASGWQAVWIDVELGNIQLKEGVNTIKFAKACAGDGFWFRSITLESVPAVSWCYSDFSINTDSVTKTFTKGSAFNAAGLTVNCKVYGVDTVLTAQDYTVTTPNMFTAGEKTVLVNYPAAGLTASYTVNVTEADIQTTKAEFLAADEKTTIGGGLTKNTTNGYIDNINGADAGVITYKINSSEACVANLTVLMNKMQKGTVFTNLVSITVNGVEYKYAEAINFDGNNQNWVLTDPTTGALNWIETVLGSLQLQEGENTITFTTKCKGNGFWFRGISLESTATLTWVTE